MRRVIPLLCILLLLCGCGGGQSVSAPDEAARLVIFPARSAAASRVTWASSSNARRLETREKRCPTP